MAKDTRIKELLALIQASEEHRAQLKELWMKIENLNAAIASAQSSVDVSRQRRAARDSGQNPPSSQSRPD